MRRFLHLFFLVFELMKFLSTHKNYVKIILAIEDSMPLFMDLLHRHAKDRRAIARLSASKVKLFYFRFTGDYDRIF